MNDYTRFYSYRQEMYIEKKRKHKMLENNNQK